MQNCVWANCAPASIFLSRLAGTQLSGGSTGASATPRKKGSEPPICRPFGNSERSRICAASRVSPVEFEIKHGLRIRLIAGFGIIAGQNEKIGHSERSRPQQLALKRDPVAIPAGDLKDRFDAIAQKNGCRNERIEMRPRACAVRDVHRIGEAAQWQGVRQKVFGVGRERRSDFRRHNELARIELCAKRYRRLGTAVERHKSPLPHQDVCLEGAAEFIDKIRSFPRKAPVGLRRTTEMPIGRRARVDGAIEVEMLPNAARAQIHQFLQHAGKPLFVHLPRAIRVHVKRKGL